MESPSSTRPRHAVRMRRPALALTAAAAAVLVTSAGTAPAHADPGDTGRLTKLNKQIAQLDKEYGGDLAKLKDAQYGIQKARQKQRLLQQDLDSARVLVAQMAATQYMTGTTDPAVAVLASDDPDNVLNNASLASHVASNQAAKVRQIQQLVTEQQKAREEYDKKVQELEKDIAELRTQKRKVQALIKKFKPESPSSGMGGVTPRMLKVKNTIDIEFGPFPIIGCVRTTGDPQDHATGRACDFMVSTGGTMPSASGKALGDRTAQYAISNANRLGIKYVIWRQRIYDMRSPGWRTMEDRGGITANHYDHVHISVF
ncbi:hypothetical protein Acsp04_57530 [Actinomadura sp. NBRC 104425]|uniref:coiled-coil domain-containing protein n=1 Tax=Actinomadura sp. NBRC 104425 TaxID=3032204 RepID=UPI0024A240DA|nr:hypothetical protein [Actinomadura sp. NBRC 104425]GLZ15518.1 hypothetical protein Acsp04_57530 [Actinomadura sp. NBRC 104425]